MALFIAGGDLHGGPGSLAICKLLSSHLPTLKNSVFRVRRPILPVHQSCDLRKASGPFRTLFPQLYIGIVILREQVNESAL